jgi:spore coat polysaccharide biosynthesis predicted glycosyltransferase SpsG
LRDEFLIAGAAPRERDGRIRSVLVAFGSDGGAHTLRALAALADSGGVAVTVVTAAIDPALRALVERNGWTLQARVDDMAARLDAADLAIGACGTSAWERAYLGVPAIAWAIADNQREAVDGLVRAGAIATLAQPDTGALAGLIAALRDDPARVRAMGTSARAIMRDHARATAELDAFLTAPRPAPA